MFPNSLPIFAGHFPGRPLVPGVFLIEAVRVVVERALDATLNLTGVDEARFTREVRPDEPVMLEVSWRRDGDGYVCEASAQVGEEPAAKLRVLLRA